MNPKEFTQVQILWGIAGIILFAAGILAFLGRNTLAEIALYLGFAMLLSGLINIYI